MSNPSHKVPASPQTGDTDTESLYGAPPDGSAGPDPEEGTEPVPSTQDEGADEATGA